MLSHSMLTTSLVNTTGASPILPLNSNFTNSQLVMHENLKQFAKDMEENYAKMDAEYGNKRVKRDANEEDKYKQERAENVKYDKCNQVNFNAGKRGYYKTMEEWLFCGKLGKGLYNCFLGMKSLCSSGFNVKPGSQCANEAYTLGEESYNGRNINLEQLKCAPKSQNGVYFITDVTLNKKNKLVTKKKCANMNDNSFDCKTESSPHRG